MRVSVLLWAAMCVALLAMASTSVRASRGDSEAESEAAVLQGVDHSVIASAASEIMQALEAENTLNADAVHGASTEVVEAGSAEDKALEAAAAVPSKPVDAFAFLSEVGSTAKDTMDVESNLDSIAMELDSVLNSQSAAQATQEAKVDRSAHAKRSRRAHKRAAAHKAAVSKRAAAVAAAKRVEAVKNAPAPVHKLARRLDAYRAARGHAEEDVSALESSAHSRVGAVASSGYSVPSAYGPLAAAPPAAQAVPQAFQGQVAANPYAANMWSALGLAAPAPVVPQAVAAAPTAQVAGVGLLLQALKKLQEQQQTNALAAQLATLLAAQRPAAVQAPAVVQSPFNAFQNLMATPQGYQNPSLLPYAQNRLLPGQIPGQSPSYPSFIPQQSQSVGVDGAETVELGH